jgi:hypothetical protein
MKRTNGRRIEKKEENGNFQLAALWQNVQQIEQKHKRTINVAGENQ